MQRDFSIFLRGSYLRAALLDRDTEFESTREGFPVVSDLRGILPLVEQATHAVRT